MIRIAIVDDEEPFRDRIEEDRVRRPERGNGRNRDKKIPPTASAFMKQSAPGETFDILLADIRMAGMDGMELGRKIRREESGIVYHFCHLL